MLVHAVARNKLRNDTIACPIVYCCRFILSEIYVACRIILNTIQLQTGLFDQRYHYCAAYDTFVKLNRSIYDLFNVFSLDDVFCSI